ncbi:MAG: ribosome maturation factor RimM [Desulforhopalus sp.]
MTEEYTYPAEEYILLGKITKAHGLRGEVKIFCYSGHPENISGYHEIVLVDRSARLSRQYGVKNSRVQGKTAIVQLASITTRSEAEAIEGRGVLLAKKYLPDAGEGEYYWHQYIGKPVLDTNGDRLGRVKALFNNGAQDVLVVVGHLGEILIPVTKDTIVQDTAGELIADPPPGLIELNSDSGG